MSKLLIIIISTIQMVVFDAFAIDQCLNEFLVVKAESQPRTSSAKIESQFRLSPEEGLAKNIVFSLANMHPLVTKSQIDIFKGMLESTSSNLVLLYGDNQSLADWQSDILRLLAPISPAHQARLIFVPTRVTNLAWARDFVPATVSNAYASHLVSFRYAKDEDLAKRTTEEMARAFGLSKPVYLDLFVDGGAYMIDSEGRLFISEIVKTRNKALSAVPKLELRVQVDQIFLHPILNCLT